MTEIKTDSTCDLLLRYRIRGVVTETSSSDENILVEETRTGSRRTIRVRALKELRLYESSIRISRAFYKDDRIMANGYQSWTETREFLPGEHLNDLSRLPAWIENRFHFRAYGSQALWPMDKSFHLAFDYACIRGREPLFIGSFNHRNAYLLIQFLREEGEIVLHSDVSHRFMREGETFTIFDYTLDEDGADYFSSYTPRTDKKLFGYTSWYNHYQEIDEKLILEALEEADDRFDLFQIDDGFETFVGDWLDIDPVKFPRGLKPLVDRIHERGMLAGIWLSPFVAENDSRLMQEHPDWIARDKNDDFIYAGCNWSGDAVLDINNPRVVDYIRKVLRYYTGLGFDFFKLDFLYAVNLRRIHGKTHAETAEFAYGLLREELGDRLILGCGATLSNAFGRFDYCRIGPDVSLRFDDIPYMRIFHPERISTKVTLQNTIFRSDLDGHMFLNDPDVFLLRDDNIKLSRKQRESLTKINALFGSLLMTSDNIGTYDRQKTVLLEEALDLFHHGHVLKYKRQGRRVRI
ncbi:MAG: alpha-galactosidase, partial [Eubacterium sp.]|nr:alpha-galactosidase [Eubacterium sp.]